MIVPDDRKGGIGGRLLLPNCHSFSFVRDENHPQPLLPFFPLPIFPLPFFPLPFNRLNLLLLPLAQQEDVLLAIAFGVHIIFHLFFFFNTIQNRTSYFANVVTRSLIKAVLVLAILDAKTGVLYPALSACTTVFFFLVFGFGFWVLSFGFWVFELCLLGKRETNIETRITL